MVDTNVLVYAADSDSPFHKRCHELLDKWRHHPAAWYVTWGILYEILRVSTHPRVFRKPWSARRAWSFVEALLASSGLGILAATERHAAVAGDVMSEIPHLSTWFRK